MKKEILLLLSVFIAAASVCGIIHTSNKLINLNKPLICEPEDDFQLVVQDDLSSMKYISITIEPNKEFNKKQTTTLEEIFTSNKNTSTLRFSGPVRTTTDITLFRQTGQSEINTFVKDPQAQEKAKQFFQEDQEERKTFVGDDKDFIITP